jgi:hypothetical protein
MTFNTDLQETNVQLKRIADLLEEYIHPAGALKAATDRQSVEVSRIQPRSRWEAEKEQRAWWKQTDEVAGIMPRK